MKKKKKGFIKNINLAICSEMSTSVSVKKLDTEVSSVSKATYRHQQNIEWESEN